MYVHIECKFIFHFETPRMISLYRVYSKEINIVENMLKHIRKPLPIAKHTARNKEITVVKFDLVDDLNRPVPKKHQNVMIR